MRFFILFLICMLTFFFVSEIPASDEAASFEDEVADFGDDIADFNNKHAVSGKTASFDSALPVSASKKILQPEQCIPPVYFPEREIRQEKKYSFLHLISVATLIFCGFMLLYKRSENN